ncbi:MAG TPA: hypothetical protein VF092_24745 [Longimicrobium sp.]
MRPRAPSRPRVMLRAEVSGCAVRAAPVHLDAPAGGLALDGEFVVRHTPAARGFGDPGVLLLRPLLAGEPLA